MNIFWFTVLAGGEGEHRCFWSEFEGCYSTSESNWLRGVSIAHETIKSCISTDIKSVNCFPTKGISFNGISRLLPEQPSQGCCKLSPNNPRKPWKKHSHQVFEHLWSFHLDLEASAWTLMIFPLRFGSVCSTLFITKQTTISLAPQL